MSRSRGRSVLRAAALVALGVGTALGAAVGAATVPASAGPASASASVVVVLPASDALVETDEPDGVTTMPGVAPAQRELALPSMVAGGLFILLGAGVLVLRSVPAAVRAAPGAVRFLRGFRQAWVEPVAVSALLVGIALVVLGLFAVVT